MFVVSKVSFFISVLFCCIFLSTCSNTTHAENQYATSIDFKTNAAETLRKNKILAARKRAKATKFQRTKKFRENRIAARKARRADRAQRTINRKKSKRPSAKKLTKKTARRATKTTKSYVGGRSKGISRNSKAWKCVPGRLKKVIGQISRKYGRVIINSTHRSRSKNRRSGGRRGSYHLRCQAVDFRVKGNTRGLTRWLARHPLVGGYNRYPSGFYHIDTGPKRTW